MTHKGAGAVSKDVEFWNAQGAKAAALGDVRAAAATKHEVESSGDEAGQATDAGQL